MRPIKESLRPQFERMQMWLEPAKKNASAGYQALKSIMDGPDYLPASVAEEGLGGLKTLAREGEPNLRDVNSAVGARGTQLLQAAIDKAVGDVGGEKALQALRKARATHAAKMGVSEVLHPLRDEPVQVFQQATWAKDAGIDRLRSIAKQAPKEMPKLGRAYLEDIFSDTMRGGGYNKAQSVWNKWANLGPETKKILYTDPMLVRDLDNFFLLAKKLSERPNPSGSAVVGATAGGLTFAVTNPATGVPILLSGAGMAKLLYSREGVRLLTRGMKLPIRSAGSAVVAEEILSIAGQETDRKRAEDVLYNGGR